MIKISVIISVYNKNQYLKKCLDSILNQTLTEIEVICIEEEGFESIDLFNSYDDDRLIFISQKDKNVSISLNDGIKIAKGEYIYFINSNGWLELDALEKLYNNAKFNDSDIILFNSIGRLNNYQIFNNAYLPLNDSIDYKSFVFDYNYDLSLVMSNMFKIGSKLYKSSLIKENQFKFHWDRYHNYVLFHIKSMISAKSINYFPEFLYNYHELNDSPIIILNDKSDYNILFDIFDDIEEYLVDLHLFDKFKLNFFRFKINELLNILLKLPDEFKEDFFQSIKLNFIKINLNNEDLEKIPFQLRINYKNVLNSDSYFNLNLDNEFKHMDDFKTQYMLLNNDSIENMYYISDLTKKYLFYLENDLINQNKQIVSLQDEIKNKNNEIKSLKKFKQQSENMKKSTSWKITSPFRKFRDLLKK